MIGKLLILTAAPLMLAAGSIEEENVADARCIAAIALVPQGKDAAATTAMQAAMVYYMGRLDGRAPAADLKAIMTRAGNDLKAVEVGPTLVRCGDLLQRRGAVYQAIGKAMQAEGGSAK